MPSNTPGSSGPQDQAHALAIQLQQLAALHLSNCADFHTELVDKLRDEIAALERRIASEIRPSE
jgi:hypothetical protein